MTWRYQLPVRSPVEPRAILRGLLRRRRVEEVETLGGELAAEYGARSVVPTSSGTAALTLAIDRSRHSGSPTVALPAWGCPDLATAALGAGARVRLYDLDPATLAPDPVSFRIAAQGADAAVVAHFYGVPADHRPLLPILGATGTLLVDDAAQGVGASLAGLPVGAAGDLGVLSFGRGKGRTGGRGGALLALSARAAERVTGLGLNPQGARGPWKDAALLLALWALGRPTLYRVPASIPWLHLGETLFHPPPPLMAMSPFAAAVVRAGAGAVEEESATRREAGRWWLERLTEAPGIETVRPPADAEPGWLRFPVLVPAARVSEFRSGGMRRRGVMPGYPRLLVELPGFAQSIDAAGPGRWPGARLLAERLFTLPVHGLVSPRERSRLLDLVLGQHGQGHPPASSPAAGPPGGAR